MFQIITQLVALLLIGNVFVEGKHYRAHDSVGIVANTIGPFNNPTETYPVSIFSLKLDILKVNLYFIYNFI